MLRLDQLRLWLKGALHVHESLQAHGVKHADVVADIIFAPPTRKEMGRLLDLLEAEGVPHLIVTRKGRVRFSGKRFHGAVVVSPGKVGDADGEG